MNKKNWLFVGMILILLVQGCNMPGTTPTLEPAPTLPPVSEEPTDLVTTIIHKDIPVLAPDSKPYPDVTSNNTADEKRAPYGDSYEIDRLERPFTQDMTYIPDMDISSFSISEDNEWYFVSIGLIGNNPNNPSNIRYMVELDTNRDSFGDLMIVAEPPFTEAWTADNIKIYSDTNHDSAGVSPARSDATFNGDGYDKLISSPLDGVGDDLDVAWVHTTTSPFAILQFAFKKSLSGDSFMYAVMTDAGLKDVARLDYVDYFTERDAGSPIRVNPFYPLKALYAVDNTCFQAFGFTPTQYEPKICPDIIQPKFIQRDPKAPPPPTECQDPGNCPYGWAGEPYCTCTPG